MDSDKKDFSKIGSVHKKYPLDKILPQVEPFSDIDCDEDVMNKFYVRSMNMQIKRNFCFRLINSFITDIAKDVGVSYVVPFISARECFIGEGEFLAMAVSRRNFPDRAMTYEIQYSTEALEFFLAYEYSLELLSGKGAVKILKALAHEMRHILQFEENMFGDDDYYVSEEDSWDYEYKWTVECLPAYTQKVLEIVNTFKAAFESYNFFVKYPKPEEISLLMIEVEDDSGIALNISNTIYDHYKAKSNL